MLTKKVIYKPSMPFLGLNRATNSSLVDLGPVLGHLTPVFVGLSTYIIY